MTKNIIEQIIEAGFADNPWRANNIAKGLELENLTYNPKAQMKRVALYRDFRNAGVSSEVAFKKAIAGEVAPIPLPLFEGVLHSEAE